MEKVLNKLGLYTYKQFTILKRMNDVLSSDVGELFSCCVKRDEEVKKLKQENERLRLKIAKKMKRKIN